MAKYSLLSQIRRLAEQDTGLSIVREDEGLIDFSKHEFALQREFSVNWMEKPTQRYYDIAKKLLKKHSVRFTPSREWAYDQFVESRMDSFR